VVLVSVLVIIPVLADVDLTFYSNFIIAITFPPLRNAFKPQGAFGWYAAWK